MTKSSAEETLAELQTWLSTVRDKRLTWADELRAKSAYNSAELWTREAKMVQETLDWLETKRNGAEMAKQALAALLHDCEREAQNV